MYTVDACVYKQQEGAPVDEQLEGASVDDIDEEREYASS